MHPAVAHLQTLLATVGSARNNVMDMAQVCTRWHGGNSRSNEDTDAPPAQRGSLFSSNRQQIHLLDGGRRGQKLRRFRHERGCDFAVEMRLAAGIGGKGIENAEC